MRKEQFIAIILGSIIGVVVAFSLWRALRAQNDVSQPKQESTTQETPSASSNEFAIVTPADFAVVTDEEINIEGLSNGGELILAISDGVSTAKSDPSGSFSIPVTLNSGVNKITLWSAGNASTPRKTELTLVYTTKLATTNPATSVFGTVTDITEDTLQLRTDDGEIKQLAITDETTYVKIIDGSSDIGFADVAIGDYIAALGEADGAVMKVGRVLVTTNPGQKTTTTLFGTIDTLSSKEFLVNSHENEKVSIDATGSVKTYSAKEDKITTTRLSTAEPGDKIVIIGEFEGDELVASTIILL